MQHLYQYLFINYFLNGDHLKLIIRAAGVINNSLFRMAANFVVNHFYM